MTQQVLFNGAVLVRAGGASKVDVSAFQNYGAGGVGIVGIVGEADEGEPMAAKVFNNPRAVVSEYGSGPLADAADLAFLPSNDPRVPGGATSLICLKVNNSTQSAKSLLAGTAPMAVVTSKKYGVKANQISAQVSTSGAGKIVEFKQAVGVADQIVETSPVLGDIAEFTIQYTGNGTTATMTTSATSLTTTVAGQTDGSVSLSLNYNDFPTIKDLVEFIKLQTGYVATAVTRNPYAITGPDLDYVAAVDIKTGVYSAFAKLYRVISWINANSALVSATRSPSTTTGATSGSETGTGLSPFNLEPAQTLLVAVDGAGAVTATFNATAATSAGAAATYASMNGKTVIFEIDDNGETQTVAFTAGATDATTSAAEFNAQARDCRAVVNGTEVDIVSDKRGTASRVDITGGTGLAEFGHAISVVNGTGNVANINAVTHAEAKAVIELAIPALTYTPATGSGTAPVLTSNTSGVSSSIQVTGGTAQATFGFDALLHSGTNAGLPGGTGVPDNVGPVYLTGGARGTSNNTSWQDGFDLLGKVRANQIVPLASYDLSADGYGSTATFASIAAMSDAHSAYRSSTAGKSERQTFVGMDGTKTELLDLAGTFQSPHSIVSGHKVTRANAAGNLVDFPEWGLAVILAGMRAGSVLGEPCTWKGIRCSGVSQDASWNPEDDGADLILGGVTFAFGSAQDGYKFDRVVSTYTKEDNAALFEESIIQGWKNVSYGLRTQLERRFTGTRGTPATVQGIYDAATAILEAYRDEGQIVDSILEDGTVKKAYRELSVTLNGDIAYLSAIISPVSGINFQLNTLFAVPAIIAA